MPGPSASIYIDKPFRNLIAFFNYSINAIHSEPFLLHSVFLFMLTDAFYVLEYVFFFNKVFEKNV